MFPQPGSGGLQPAGEVLGAVAAAGWRVDGLELPHRAATGCRFVEIVAGERELGVGIELEPRPVPGLRAEHELEVAGTVELQVAVVHRPDDPVAVLTVAGAPVDRHRQIDGVAAVPGDSVGPVRVQRGELIVGVGVVATPLQVRADDVDQNRVVPVSPHVGVDGDAQQAERQPIRIEQVGFVQRRLRGQHLLLEGADLVEQFVERPRQLCRLGHRFAFFRFGTARTPWITREHSRSASCAAFDPASMTTCPW